MNREIRVQAVCLGPELDVHAPTVGVVHSVFRQAANLSVEGDLWTLLAEDKGDLPFGIRVPMRTLESLDLRRGEVVSVRAGYVGIGSRIVVDCRSAERWSPTFVDTIAPGIERRLAIVEEAARGRSWHESPAMARAVSDAIEDESALASVLAEVVGRGPGATPSGDDVLVGVFAGLVWSCVACPRLCVGMRDDSTILDPNRIDDPPHAHAKPWAWHTDHAESLRRLLMPLLAGTTDVSRHLLRQAANGHFSRDLHELVAAILGSSTADVERCIRRVVETGATSGADMCEGLLAFAPSYLVRHREEISA